MVEPVAAALVQFDQLWDVMYPVERLKLVNALIEVVRYTGDEEGLQIKLRLVSEAGGQSSSTMEAESVYRKELAARVRSESHVI